MTNFLYLNTFQTMNHINTLHNDSSVSVYTI